MASSNRERLVAALTEKARRLGRADAVATPARIAALIRIVRSDTPGAERRPDEELLELILEHVDLNGAEGLPPGNPEVRELYAIGRRLLYELRFDEAKVPLLRAQQMAVATGDDNGNAWTKQYLGRLERDSKRLKAAIDYYEAALDSAVSSKDTFLIAVIYDQLGTTYRLRGDLDRAETYYEMALAASPKSKSFVTGNLAILAKKRGDKQKASKLNEESIREYKLQDKPEGEALALLHKAQELFQVHDYAQATKTTISAQVMAAEAGHAQVVQDTMDLFGSILQVGFESPDNSVMTSVCEADWDDVGRGGLDAVLVIWFEMCRDTKMDVEAAQIAWSIGKYGSEALRSSFKSRGWVRSGPLHQLQSSLATSLKHCKPNGLDFGRLRLALALCYATVGKRTEAITLLTECRDLFGRLGPSVESSRAQFFLTDIMRTER